MTDNEMWEAVRRELVALRTGKDWKPFDIQRAGGPTYKTVQAIDRGELGRVEMIAKYAGALGLSLADVLRTVLCGKERSTPETEKLLRAYARTTDAGRLALLATATALPDAVPSASDRSRAALPE